MMPPPMLEQLSKRYDNKPVWVTEFACPAWIGGTFAKNGLAAQYCDTARHEAKHDAAATSQTGRRGLRLPLQLVP